VTLAAEPHDERASKLVARYDAHAAAYRELWAQVLRRASIRLLDALGQRSVRRAIDVGAGVGSLCPDLRALFPSALLIAIDRSHGMLTRAPSGTIRVVADARALPLPTDSVDLALCVFMLFHLAQPIDGLAEARRVLRRGGCVGTATWGTDLESLAFRIWTACLDEHGAAPPDPVTQPQDDVLDTPEKMEGLLQTAGFTQVRAWTDRLVTTIDLEHLLKLKTSMGNEKTRFDSLDRDAQVACVAEARRKMEALAPADFTASATIVYAIAT
jgi:ubiquinone/menaquinone biosynthesis C-methylase UbiE